MDGAVACSLSELRGRGERGRWCVMWGGGERKWLISTGKGMVSGEEHAQGETEGRKEDGEGKEEESTRGNAARELCGGRKAAKAKAAVISQCPQFEPERTGRSY